MINTFLDTDVILDFLGEREPFAPSAFQIFVKAKNEEIIIYTSSNSITNAYYILCKYTDEENSRELVYNLIDYLKIIPVTFEILTKAFKSSFKDVEDAVQHYCALSEQKIKYIVTRNIRDYKGSQIEVKTPEEFLKIADK